MKKSLIFAAILSLSLATKGEQKVDKHRVKVIHPTEVTLKAVDYSSKPVKFKKAKKLKKSKRKLAKRKASSKSTKLLSTAKKYLGVRYVWGGNTKRGLDCSGFVKKVYKFHKVNLPRTSGKMFRVGKKVNKRNAKKGDLIFFSDSRRSIGHVGIIIDPKKMLMIHASSGAKKVTISSYNKSYYRKHFKGVRRVSS